ncbi:MAG: SoxR reducing system RseC family protein [Zhongshania sp.]|uniref:SoxR reducing system RseC family protein n=1 Tax=Zhongshania sp. TaxID=1971902 RepID=UPI002623C538|nr:SoxR reducing system RseC family protein [Zhongshania sp.]MDF1690977.1 SoxR reducing system RseC family protein [Zhongshania sp.]
MISETGRVVGIDHDALWVETIQRSTCSSCSAQKGCGQGLMNKALGGRRNQLRVKLGNQSADDFQLDDQLEIGIPERALVGGAMVVYLVPLFTMLVAMAGVSHFIAGDVAAAAGALFGFVAGMAILSLHARWIRDNPDYQPQILAKKPSLAAQPVSVFDSPYSV